MPIVSTVYKVLSGNDPEKVTLMTKNRRMSICRKCPKLVFKTNCSECGCFVNWKTDFKAEECPIGKW
jgi:hypothetical protein